MIELKALYLPPGATFDAQTKVFRWLVGSTDDHVRIQAVDTTYNLTSTHEITFQIIEATTGGVIQHTFSFSLFSSVLLIFCFDGIIC